MRSLSRWVLQEGGASVAGPGKESGSLLGRAVAADMSRRAFLEASSGLRQATEPFERAHRDAVCDEKRDVGGLLP